MATVVSDFPRAVRVIENTWITLSDGTRLAAKIWLPEAAEDEPVPGGARVLALPQARRHRCAGSAAVPVPGRPWLRRGPRRPARPWRLRGFARGRVHPSRAGRRGRGDR